jgi:hypothetical protein
VYGVVQVAVLETRGRKNMSEQINPIHHHGSHDECDGCAHDYHWPARSDKYTPSGINQEKLEEAVPDRDPVQSSGPIDQAANVRYFFNKLNVAEKKIEELEKTRDFLERRMKENLNEAVSAVKLLSAEQDKVAKLEGFLCGIPLRVEMVVAESDGHGITTKEVWDCARSIREGVLMAFPELKERMK